MKESERKIAYRPRGPHKEGCLCAICKGKARGAGIAQAVAEEEVLQVDITTILWGGKLEYGGKLYKKVNVNCDREAMCLPLVTKGNEQFTVPTGRVLLPAGTLVVGK